MGTTNCYDILERILKYRTKFTGHNPVVTFEYVLNFEDLGEVMEQLEQLGIHFEIMPNDKRKESNYCSFNFLGVQVEINKNFPL